MELTEDGQGYRLSTGREFLANCGILGLGPGSSLREGYDGCVYQDDPRGESDERPFTREERVEISRFMVLVWMDWADDHGPRT